MNSIVDIRSVCNRGFRDEPSVESLGGWTGQGNNDMRGMTLGELPVGGISFSIIDPKENNGASIIALRNASDGFAAERTIPVNATCDYIYLLHTVAWSTNGAIAGIVSLVYDNGEICDTHVVANQDVGDWWLGAAVNAKLVRLDKANPSKSPVFIFASAIKNKKPERKVVSIILRTSKEAHSKVIWLVLGITTGIGECALSFERPAIDRRDHTGWYPFRLKETLSKHALIDCSRFLDAPAGKHGWVISKGGSMYFENGKRARFFGTNINASCGIFPEHEHAERIADTFARNGINMVRLTLMESVLMEFVSDDVPSRFTIDEGKWDKFDYFVKCLKDHGVYMMIDSIGGVSSRRFYARFSDMDGVIAYGKYGNHRPWALFDPRFKELAKEFMNSLLNHRNKYTGLCMKNDAAFPLAILINEQSMFLDWYEANGSDPHYDNLFMKLFNGHLRKRYGTRESLAQAWNNKEGISSLHDAEDPFSDTVAPSGLNDLRIEHGNWRSLQSPVRVAETIRFYRELQKGYTQEMITHLRTFGYKGLVSCSNLICGEPELDAMSAGEYTAQHMYWDHVQFVEGNKRHFFMNIPSMSVNILEGGNALIEQAIAATKVNTLPITATESAMMWAHEWRSSYCLPLFATASFQNWDAIYPYEYMGGYGKRPGYFEVNNNVLLAPTVSFNDPALMGILPNAALMFHRTDITPSKILVQVSYGDVEKDRYKNNFHGASFPFNYLTHVCRVVSFFDKPDSCADFTVGNGGQFMPDRFNDARTIKELTAGLDDAMKTAGLLSANRGINGDSVVSETGEMRHDWGRMLFIVDSPRTQGFSGFPKSDEMLQFKGISIKTRSPFATIVMSSLDDRPLDESKRMLLSAVARVENNKDEYVYDVTATAANGMKYGESFTITHKSSPLMNPEVQPQDDAMLLVEPVYASIRLAAKRLCITPLAPDMTPLTTPSTVDASDGFATVAIGMQKTIWFIVERF